MSKKTKGKPHRSKPYENKLAERANAKRAMRSGGQTWERPEHPKVAQQARLDQPSEMID